MVNDSSDIGRDRREGVFSGLFGGCLGLALLKFGNPVIFDQLIDRPSNIWEFVFQPWPITWGYFLLAGVLVCGWRFVRFTVSAPRWLVVLPFIWLGWQVVATFKTIDLRLSLPTLAHFTACVLCFYLGLFALSRVRRLLPFWIGLLVSFLAVLWIGFEQHYGGLEASRRFFYEQPNWREFPPEYLKKIASDRIFSTLVYPNAFAGVIVLLLPVMVPTAWKSAHRLGPLLQKVFTGLLIYAASACLFWTGSKAGWLVALVVGLFWLSQLSIDRKIKGALAVGAVLVGLIGFFVKFNPYFRKGATSVSARFDYWKAALTTSMAFPVLGSGPGTFSIQYRKVKPPEAEMARLAHNDLLEQASDSGWPGFLSYLGFLVGAAANGFAKIKSVRSSFILPTWLGLLGWALQSLVEFFLYIPALAWLAFTLLGWLCGGKAKNE